MNNSKLFHNWKEKFTWKKTEWGLTNENFLLDNKYLLRQSPIIPNPFTQRKNEVAIQTLLQNKKINVPVVAYYYDDEKRFIYISEFQKNAQNFGEKTLNKNNLQKVSAIIKKLHGLDYENSNIKKLDMKENLQNHINEAKREYGQNMKETNELMFNFLKNFDFTNLVVSHNDLMKENILVDADDYYYIIDYEYCGLNVRFYDYAVFIASTNLITNPEMHRYWLSLFNLTKKADLKKMHFFTLYRTLIGYYWANNKWETYHEKKYYDLMMHKWKQSQWLYQEIKKMSNSSK